MQRSARGQVRVRGERGAEVVAVVVIAGHDDPRQPERAEHGECRLVLLGSALVDEVAGHEHEVRSPIEAMQVSDRVGQHPVRIGDVLVQFIARADVHVGKLRDQHVALCVERRCVHFPMTRVEKKLALLVFPFRFEFHADFPRDVHRGRVLRKHHADQPRQPQHVEGVVHDALRRFGRQALSLECRIDEVRDLDFVPAVERPRQQPAAADEALRQLVDRGPETQFGMRRMAVQEPLEFLLRLPAVERAVGKVATDLRVAIQREQRIEVVALQAPQRQARRLEDQHAAR